MKEVLLQEGKDLQRPYSSSFLDVVTADEDTGNAYIVLKGLADKAEWSEDMVNASVELHAKTVGFKLAIEEASKNMRSLISAKGRAGAQSLQRGEKIAERKRKLKKDADAEFKGIDEGKKIISQARTGLDDVLQDLRKGKTPNFNKFLINSKDHNISD